MLKRNRSLGVAVFGAVCALPLLILPSVAMAQNAVVLESTAAAYKAGQQIASGRSVQLVAGEKLTVITEKGSSFELAGPLNKPLNITLSELQARIQAPSQAPSQVSNQVKTLIQRLTAQKAVDNSALGVIRQSLPSAESPASAMSVIGFSSVLRYIPVGLNGKFCIQKSGKAPRFKGAEPTQTLRLKAVGEGPYQTLVRNPSLGVWAWPAGMPTTRGGKYLLRDGEASIPFVIELVPVQLPLNGVDGKSDGRNLESTPYVAAVLAAQGCAWQAQVLTQSDQF
ncbi:MAG: hypothetical protein QE278_03790 [Limnobacter sp.]|nr:hypothetical protein [Limnobacter sp.]